MKRHAARPSTIARAIFLPAPPLAGYIRNTREREIALFAELCMALAMDSRDVHNFPCCKFMKFF